MVQYEEHIELISLEYTHLSILISDLRKYLDIDEDIILDISSVTNTYLPNLLIDNQRFNDRIDILIEKLGNKHIYLIFKQLKAMIEYSDTLKERLVILNQIKTNS